MITLSAKCARLHFLLNFLINSFYVVKYIKFDSYDNALTLIMASLKSYIFAIYKRDITIIARRI